MKYLNFFREELFRKATFQGLSYYNKHTLSLTHSNNSEYEKYDRLFYASFPRPLDPFEPFPLPDRNRRPLPS